MQTKYSFMGLILGCTPLIFKQANGDKGFRLHYLFFWGITFLSTCLLLWIESTLSSANTIYCTTSLSFFFLVLSGFFMSIGVVIPGMSSTVILMLLGIYDIYLSSVSNLNITILFPMGIGLVIGGFVFLKLIQFLLKKYPSETYYGIIGFVFGSLPILYPGFSFDVTGLSSLLFFFSCIIIGYFGEMKK